MRRPADILTIPNAHTPTRTPLTPTPLTHPPADPLPPISSHILSYFS